MIYLILIASALLRFYNNTALALWHDEAFSALYLRYPFSEMMHRVGLDVHPPLYYLVLRAWAMFAGDSLLSLRLLSIIFGVLTVWAGYMFVKTAFGNKELAQICALILAINPFQIQFALEARMYTIGTFLIIFSSYLLIKKRWLGYALVTAAAMYAHYYLAFSIAAQGLFIVADFLKTRQGRNLAHASLAYLGAFALYLPWLPTLLNQVTRVESAYWIPPMAWWSVPDTIWKMIFGGTVANHAAIIIGSIVAIMIFIYLIKHVQNFQKWHILLSVVVPMAAAVILSWRSNIFLYRYFVFASVYFTILVSITLYYVPKFWKRWLLLSLLIAGMFFSFLKNWSELDIKNHPGMAAASEMVNLQAQKNDKIIVGSSLIYFTFKYYNETPILPQLISDRPIRDIPHFSGTAILTDDDLILDLSKFTKGQTVWLLWTTGFGGSKPGLPKNWSLVSESKFADSPGFKGDIFVTEYQVN